MTRPNFNLMQRQQRDLAQFVGETAQWRHFVGLATGSPAYGVGDEPIYHTLTVTGLFAPMTLEEVQAAGGQYSVGDVKATLVDCAPDSRDEIVWRGTYYRVESDPIPQRIVGGTTHCLLRRGGTR